MFNMPGVQPARTQEEVDRRINLWHTLTDEAWDNLGQPGLADYLGWSKDDYWTWAYTGRIPNA